MYMQWNDESVCTSCIGQWDEWYMLITPGLLLLLEGNQMKNVCVKTLIALSIHT